MDSWLVDHDEGVDYNGPMAESIADAFEEGAVVDQLHTGITDQLDLDGDYSNVAFCANVIQQIVNNGKTKSGDFAGSVRVQSYLNSIAGFVKKLDSGFLAREGDKATRAELKKYQTDVVKFASSLQRIKK